MNQSLKINDNDAANLSFYGGIVGALLPMVIFIWGVISIALSGAPDEKGFWPVLILALACGLILSKDRTAFSETVISGMSQKIVMVMITAWLLASIIGILMTQTGFVEALIWLSNQVSLNGVSFVLVSFGICCIVSLSTGSSFATILICSPLLYPTGAIMGSPLPVLAGAILGGATFGDFIAPISDTTIASALSQKVKIGDAIKSRIKFFIPALCFAIIGLVISAFASESSVDIKGADQTMQTIGDPKGLPMLLVPAFIIFLFLKGKHLLHGLLMGLVVGTILGLALNLLPVQSVLSLDLDNFVAKSFIIDGISRALGLSVFTILLMGLVATVKASGLFNQLIRIATTYANNQTQGELWISGVMSAVLLLTTHSIVAILTVADFAQKTGARLDVSPIRRSNLLSLIACVLPFLLPYFIPVILMANMTSSGEAFSIPSVSPVDVGLHNFMSWGLLLMTLITLLFGWGRKP